MANNIGYGTVLTVATSTAGTSAIGRISSISGPDASATDVETTTFDSSTRYETFIPATVNPGGVRIGLVYESSSASHKRLNGLLGSGELRTYTVTYATTTYGTEAFSAYVSGLSREMPLKDKTTCEVTLKVSGHPGFST